MDAVRVSVPTFGGRRTRTVEVDGSTPTFDAFVAELVENRTRREPVVLVGNSPGGTLAVRAAAAGAPLTGDLAS